MDSHEGSFSCHSRISLGSCKTVTIDNFLVTPRENSVHLDGERITPRPLSSRQIRDMPQIKEHHMMTLKNIRNVRLYMQEISHIVEYIRCIVRTLIRIGVYVHILMWILDI